MKQRLGGLIELDSQRWTEWEAGVGNNSVQEAGDEATMATKRRTQQPPVTVTVRQRPPARRVQASVTD